MKIFMRYWKLWLLLAVLAQFAPVFVKLAHGCENGCSAYQITPNQTVCACDEPTAMGTSVKPSDETPPRDKMPSYQREGVKVEDAPNLTETTRKQMEAEAQADYEGKKAAGLVK